MGKKRTHIKRKKDTNDKNHVSLIVHNSSCGMATKIGGN